MLTQTYPAVEYIVVDDGSTDITPDVIRSYANRLVSIRHENIGQAASLNKGWGLGSGDYLGYISADDRLLPSAVESLVQALDADPAAVVAYGDFNVIDETGAEIVAGKKTADYTKNGLLKDLICHPGPAALFRRDGFERVGGWDPQLRFVSDFEFWLRLCDVGHFVRVPKVLADYRVHRESGSVKALTPAKAEEIVTVMTAYWGTNCGRLAKDSIAKAHYCAAINHAHSGRARAAFYHFAIAITRRPRLLARLHHWREFSTALWRGLPVRS